jgi:hypothetical protein
MTVTLIGLRADRAAAGDGRMTGGMTMPATESDVDLLARRLAEAPEDAGVRGALADALDDAGDAVGADFHRWVAAKDRRPFGGLVWADYTIRDEAEDRSELPGSLFGQLAFGRLLRPSNYHPGGNWITFRDPAAALRAAWDALSRSQRAACWAWHPTAE